MTYQVEYRMLAGGIETFAITQGQEVAIQRIKDQLRLGLAVHATMRDASGRTIWSGEQA